MFQDEKGVHATSLVSDEYTPSFQRLTYRIDALKLAEGKLLVARQLPEVKN